MASRSVPWLSVALSLLLGMAGAAAAVPVEQVPSPRPGGWTTDLTGLLDAAARAELDRVAERVNAETGGELAVVVVDSVGGSDPRTYAVRLFNRWGVGRRVSNDGVLIFLAVGDRAAEIILGDGLLDPARQAASEEIMTEEMVPRFREGLLAEGLVAGARGAAERIYGVDLAAEASALPDAGSAPVVVPVDRVPAPPLVVPASPRAAAQPTRSLPPPAAARASRIASSVGPLVLLLLLLGALVSSLVIARRPPRCTSCGHSRVQLDEAVEGAFLDPEEQLEDRIGSVDHQVWVCRSCGDVLEVPRRRWLSGYRSCRWCFRRTWLTTQRVVRPATEGQEGLVQVEGRCANCGHAVTTHRIIARLPSHVSDDDDSGFLFHGSGGRSGGRSGGGGSRPSGGRSGFGGGRSSGGGSSGRW